MQNIFMGMFSCRSSQTEIAVDEWNFQPATDAVLRKAAYNVSKEIRMRLDPWDVWKLSLCRKATTDESWIMLDPPERLKKGQEGAREPRADLLLSKPKFWMGFKDTQSTSWAFPEQRWWDIFLQNKINKLFFLRDAAVFCWFLLSFVDSTPEDPSTLLLSRCFRTMQSQSLWL